MKTWRLIKDLWDAFFGVPKLPDDTLIWAPVTPNELNAMSARSRGEYPVPGSNRRSLG